MTQDAILEAITEAYRWLRDDDPDPMPLSPLMVERLIYAARCWLESDEAGEGR